MHYLSQKHTPDALKVIIQLSAPHKCAWHRCGRQSDAHGQNDLAGWSENNEGMKSRVLAICLEDEESVEDLRELIDTCVSTADSHDLEIQPRFAQQMSDDGPVLLLVCESPASDSRLVALGQTIALLGYSVHLIRKGFRYSLQSLSAKDVNVTTMSDSELGTFLRRMHSSPAPEDDDDRPHKRQRVETSILVEPQLDEGTSILVDPPGPHTPPQLIDPIQVHDTPLRYEPPPHLAARDGPSVPSASTEPEEPASNTPRGPWPQQADFKKAWKEWGEQCDPPCKVTVLRSKGFVSKNSGGRAGFVELACSKRHLTGGGGCKFHVRASQRFQDGPAGAYYLAIAQLEHTNHDVPGPKRKRDRAGERARKREANPPKASDDESSDDEAIKTADLPPAIGPPPPPSMQRVIATKGWASTSSSRPPGEIVVNPQL